MKETVTLQGMAMLGVQRSRCFNRYDAENGALEASTTWAFLQNADGGAEDVCLETALGLPTVYPLEACDNGFSGDYQGFKIAHMFGPQGAREWTRQNSEHTPDAAESQRRRHATYSRIRRLVAETPVPPKRGDYRKAA